MSPVAGHRSLRPRDRPGGNHYWPAVYLADAEGRIRFHHFGEGEYAMTEMVIQQLLVAAGAANVEG